MITIGVDAHKRVHVAVALDDAGIELAQWRGLPVVHAEDETALRDLLTTDRDGALAEATRLRNQIHALLAQLDPEYEMRLPALTSRAGLAAVKRYVAPTGTPLQRERAAAVRLRQGFSRRQRICVPTEERRRSQNQGPGTSGARSI